MTPKTTSNPRLEAEVRQHWPRLTRFYGITPDKLWVMPKNIRRAYIEALPELEAREQLARIQAAGFPYLKDQDRRSELRKLNKQANFPEPEPTRATSAEEEKATLAAMGIAVEVVSS